jgi:hypothetical protein
MQACAKTQEYAGSNEAFLKVFGEGYKKLMEADRFYGPDGNVCAKPAATTAGI